MQIREHAREWVEGYRRAWETDDLDAFLELFTEDVRYSSHPFREPHLGHEGLRAYAAGNPDQADVTARVGEPVVDGDCAAFEWSATGGGVTLAGCSIVRFGPDGRCEEHREYWHETDEARR
jgi:ketosteroid isomerase-like protein